MYLKDEAVLDPTIRPEARPVEQTSEPACIFLTGATGLIGAYLLSELLQQTQADIYCLVRSPNVEVGKQKLKKNLEDYLLWDECFSPRIIPVVGDLSKPLLGFVPEQFRVLASQFDVIYHCGADDNTNSPYSALKATNVLGTQEVLRLASQVKVKPVHFISTLSVFSRADYSGRVIREQDSIDQIAGLEIDRREGSDRGYSQSKWVAEKLVTIACSRGLSVCIYRPVKVTGDSKTGILKKTTDSLPSMLKGCIQLGCVPELAEDFVVRMTPVDYVGKAIVHISKQKESLGKVFHIVNPHTIPAKKLINWMRSFGYSLEQVTNDQWQAKLSQATENVLYQPTPRIAARESDAQTSNSARKIDCQNTLDALTGTSIVCPPIDDKLLSTYFSYFIQSGFLDAPQLSDERGSSYILKQH